MNDTTITVDEFKAEVASLKSGAPLIVKEIHVLQDHIPVVAAEIKRINYLDNRNIQLPPAVRTFVEKTFPNGRLITTGEKIDLTPELLKQIIMYCFTLVC